MINIVNEMVEQLSKRQDFALATVISSNGSTPRSAGAKMLVKTDGASIGTVGGGMLEASVAQLALQMIQQRGAVIQSFQFSGVDAADMDAICGGQVEVLVEWVDSGDELTAQMTRELQNAITRHQKAWWVTTFQYNSGTTHAFVALDGTMMGILPPDLTVESLTAAKTPRLVDFDQRRVMIEPVDSAGSAYIFGAGHVSQSLASFVKAVGFWTVVLDDRQEYASRERFGDVDELIVLESFSESLSRFSINRDSFIVIVTRGHLNDLTVLAQALKTKAGYIGMIGSKRKCLLIFEELRRQGYSEEDLRRVHAPIGLSIGAETPEEIGISIVAEMIQARTRLQKEVS